MKKADYHLHTNYSFDGKDSMEEMVKKAIERNLSEIAFTDHVDYLSLNPQYPPLPDFTAYRLEVAKLREKYTKIKILCGVEVGIGPHLNKEITQLIKKNNFDFVIGSIHDINFVDIFYSDFYKGKDKKTAYSIFFEYTLDSIKNIQCFDVLGHMDYIERYAPYENKEICYKDYACIIDEILKTLINSGRGIEINLSGYRYGLGRFHPSFEILSRYKELGGEIITIGSDAHSIEFVNSYFDNAIGALKAAGFKYFSIYSNNKPQKEAIE